MNFEKNFQEQYVVQRTAHNDGLAQFECLHFTISLVSCNMCSKVPQ